MRHAARALVLIILASLAEITTPVLCAMAQAQGEAAGWGTMVFNQEVLSDPTAVAAVGEHCLGLKADGSIVAWGRNAGGECNAPTPNTDFTAVAAGGSHSLGLKTSGAIVAWGDNSYGQCTVPPPNTGFVAVAADGWHSLGLKVDGSIIAWGTRRTMI